MKRIEPGPYLFPMPVVLVGADIGGKANFMAAAFVAITNYKPPMVACGLAPSHLTSDGIVANKAFSICVPTADMVEVVDWCGIVSGRKQDKSEVFKVFRGDVPGAPMIEECALCAECRLVQVTPYGADSLFVGEIASVQAKEEHITQGKVDWSKIAPLLFTFPDPAYWKFGEYIAKAWSVGRGYDPSKSAVTK